MLRAVAAVVCGYLAIVVAVMAIFSTAFLVLGLESVFRPGEYYTTGAWNAATLAGSFAAAIAGGWICAALARERKPVLALAGLVLVLGVAGAVSNAAKPEPGPRTGEITMTDAASKARQPDWYAMVIPVVGAAGVLLGARWKGTPGAPAAGGRGAAA
jgi:hypothetical protein